MNKKIGSDFEKKIVKMLGEAGYWAHLIVPDARGAQPFDIIAVRNGVAIAIDCKTCVDDVFRISRLEDNQIAAFDKWIQCGNITPLVVIDHNGKTVYVNYIMLSSRRSVRIEELPKFVP